MSLAATETKGRSRCDSPAPRAPTATDAATHCEAVRKEVLQTPAPPISVAAFLATALLLGRAALLKETQEPLSDGTTWTALITFLAIGAVVMRFDMLDMAKEEAKKEASQSAGAGWPWLVVSSLLVVLLGIALACATEVSAGQAPFTGILSSSPPPRVPTDSVNRSTAVHILSEELYQRSTKVKGAVEDIENIYGRYLDASLVRDVDFSARLPEAACRRANQEAAAVIASAPVRCFQSTTTKARSWNTCVQWSNEAAIFFLSAALAIGLATSRSDVIDISAEEESVDVAASFPSAEKDFSKPSQARYQWRLFACGALLLAAAASMFASLMEDM